MRHAQGAPSAVRSKKLVLRQQVKQHQGDGNTQRGLPHDVKDVHVLVHLLLAATC